MSGTLFVHVKSKSSDMREDHVTDIVKINISGTIFQVQASTLQRFPNSRLAKLVNETSVPSENDFIYFDQDAYMFGYILRCCRSGEIHVPKNICGRDFLKELEFWDIPLNTVSPCCLPALYQADESVEILQKLAEVTSDSEVVEKSKMSLTQRQKIWLFLDNPDYSVAAKVWFYCYLAVVMLSIVVYFLWMIPSLRIKPYLQGNTFQHNHSNNKIAEMVDTDPHYMLFILDLLCIFVFTLEFILRLAVCPHKVEFFKKWYNKMNAFLVITTLMAFTLELRKDFISSHEVGVFYYVVKNLYLFRLLLLLRLEKQFMGLKILILSVKDSAKELFLLLFSLLMAMCIFGGLVFCAEIHTTMFPNIGVALWWALITITTVGYGEYVPTDLPGRIIGSVCAAIGILLLALPIAVIVSNFSGFYGHRAYQKRHQDLCAKEKG